MTALPSLVEVHVDERLFHAFVRVQRDGQQVGTGQRIGLLDQNRLRGIKLFYADAETQIAGMEVLRNISRDLRVALQEPEEVVSVSGGRVAELIPWEAFDQLMDVERSEYECQNRLFAPVRRLAARSDRAPVSDYAPTRFDEPMRIAVVFGHPDGAFDSSNQQAQVYEILRELSAASEGRIASPTERSILDLASQPPERWKDGCVEEPNVVLYFGHGRGGDAPGIRAGLGDNGWLTLERLIELVRGGRRMPPFWAFLACSLGEAAPSASVIAGPRAFAILRDQGAVAMLAMRAEIRPVIANKMIREVIESMSAGSSMEVAAAHGRRAMRHSGRAKGLIDWATPAVWSVARAASGYTWGGVSRDPVAFVGLQLLRTTTKDLGLGLEDPTSEALARCNRWRAAGRVRLIADAGWTSQTRMDVASVLAAERRCRGCAVVLVDLPPGPSYAMQLRDWAAGFRGTLTPAFAESALVRALRLIEESDPEGLRVLLSITDVMVVFSEPPGYGSSDEAVLEQILAAPLSATIVFCDRPQGATDRLSGWTIDRIERSYDDAAVDALFACAPASLAFLSVIDRPISLEALTAITHEDTAPVADPRVLMSEPASGVVLIHAARQRIATLAGPEGLRAAHRSYLRTDDDSLAAYRLRGDWPEVIGHLIGAGLKAELAAFVRELVRQQGDSWLDTDWIRLERALAPAGDAVRGIADNVILRIASALLDRQEVARARCWLEPLSCASKMNEARRLAMLSEAWKAEGGEHAKERMWATLRSALAACDDAPQDSRTEATRREYQMSFARLELYFNHDAPAAKATFEHLIAIWRPELPVRPDVVRPLVAAMRNLAECLFEFEPFAGRPDSWVAAETLLAEALDLAEHHVLIGVDAEVAYSMAKLAEVRGDGGAWSREAVSRLSKCARLAKAAGHHVLLRIAELRRFRLQVQVGDRSLDADIFRALVRPLDYLGWHAWAVRYAGQARLWAARRIADVADVPGAIGLLRCNVLALAGRPALSGTSDRANLARTFAGLAVLDSVGGAWTEFQRLDWAPSWLNEHGSPSPESIWSEVV